MTDAAANDALADPGPGGKTEGPLPLMWATPLPALVPPAATNLLLMNDGAGFRVVEVVVKVRLL